MTVRNRARHTGAAGHKVKTAVTVTLALLVVAGVAVGHKIYAQYKYSQEIAKVIDQNTFYQGIKVQGVDLGGKTMSEAKSAVQTALSGVVPSVTLKVASGNQTWEVTEKDLKFQYNTDEVLKEAYAYARSGSREERYQKVQALKTSPKNFSATGKVEESSLQSALNAIAAKVDVAPQNPHATSFNAASGRFTFADGTNGVSVDRQKMLSDAESVLSKGNSGKIILSTKSVPFSGTLADLESHMKKLGSFSTVSKNSADGTYNMTKALLAANGVSVKPGATFSFFGTAGKCGKAQGYKPAGAILNGKLVQQYGGGICQASTTIYGAATRAGMTITERHNHSIPSSYCPIGQDATVSYPGLDFKFSNPTKYAVYLATSVQGRVLTAAIYGYQSDDYDSISVTSKVTETLSAPSQARYVADPSLKEGNVRMISRARSGYRATAQRTYLKNGSAVKTEALPSSYYKPEPAYYAKGTGKASASSSSAAGGNAVVAGNDDVTQQGKPAA